MQEQINNTHLLNVVIQLTRIANALEETNKYSLEHKLTKDEKEFLCGCGKKKARKKK